MQAEILDTFSRIKNNQQKIRNNLTLIETDLAILERHCDAPPTVTTNTGETPVGVGDIQREWQLPLDGNESLERFYGAPIKPGREANLAWVDFPDPQTRLFTRSGSLLKDHNDNDLPDHRCHKKVAEQIKGALFELWSNLPSHEYRKQGLHVFAGCWNYRRMRGGGRFSTHAWAIAIDICPQDNPWRVNRTSFTDETLDTFERWGLLNAGRAWGHDYQHFQAAKFSHIKNGSYYHQNGYPEWIK